jgi:hypothetical protein
MVNQKTKEELVIILDRSLFSMAYKDIERASIYGEAKLAGFILGACFIDAMAGFYSGVTKDKVTKKSGERFKNFVSKYLTRYNAEDFYKDLRCGLVHSYAEGGTYVFTDSNKAGFHFTATKTGMIVLNLEDFLADLRKAYSDFRNDVLTDNEIFLNARKRYESMYLMGLVDAEFMQDVLL